MEFVTAFQQEPPPSEPECMAWLSTALKDELISHLRRIVLATQARELPADAAEPALHSRPHPPIHELITTTSFRTAMQRLTREERRLIDTNARGWLYQQIAVDLNISESTVAELLHDARTHLLKQAAAIDWPNTKASRALERFFDGELDAAEWDTYGAHLATCDKCQNELEDLLQLNAFLIQHLHKIDASYHGRGPAQKHLPPERKLWSSLLSGIQFAYDWTRRALPLPNRRNSPRLTDSNGVTAFYSFEANDTHSLALVNVAALIAKRGRKVLIVDWDLEAPAVDKFYRAPPSKSLVPASQPGLVELLNSVADSSPLTWRDCVFPVRLSLETPAVDVIGTGRSDEGYMPRVRSLDIDRMFTDRNLGHKLEVMRSQWLAAYDTILIHSPPGITELSGVCTINLPDTLVAFFTPDEKNTSGTRRVLQRATLEHGRLPVDRRKLVTIPILVPDQARSASQGNLDPFWHERVVHELSGFWDDWLPRSRDPIEAVRLFSLGEEPGNPSRYYAACDRLASFIDSGMTTVP